MGREALAGLVLLGMPKGKTERSSDTRGGRRDRGTGSDLELLVAVTRAATGKVPSQLSRYRNTQIPVSVIDNTGDVRVKASKQRREEPPQTDGRLISQGGGG